jgi:hypothetical protein
VFKGPAYCRVGTALLSSSATKPEAGMRGVTNRCTGLMPSTSIASISSRMVRDPRSGTHRRRAGSGNNQHRHQRPELGHRTKSRARTGQIRRPSSRSKMLMVKLTRTVKGMATISVGTSETWVGNQVCLKNSLV